MIRSYGLILTGGLSSRMGGGDKALLRLADRTLLSSVIARLAPQCVALAVSASGDPSRFAETALPVIQDTVGPCAGPLAGVLAGLAHLEIDAQAEWLITVPGDTPFIPLDLVSRLAEAVTTSSSESAFATSGDRAHPLVALWSVSLHDRLRHALEDKGVRSVRAFQTELRTVAVDWPVGACDPFFNVNTPDDLTQAQALSSLFPAKRQS